MATFATGQRVLERYIVEDCLELTHMAQFYRARHDRLGYTVTLKLLPTSVSDVVAARFERAARLMARVGHPHVVSILDYGFYEQTPVIVLEEVTGESLQAVLKRRGHLPWPEALQLYVDVLEGLAAIHSAAVLHRNLTPSNIVMPGLSGGPRIKIINLDFAKGLGPQKQRITLVGSVVGTPIYMAPEQLLENAADRRSDIYAAALCAYKSLSGALPLGRALMRRCSEPAPRPEIPEQDSPVPAPLVEAIMTSLALDPADRPETCEELLVRLRGLRPATDTAPQRSVQETARLRSPRSTVPSTRAQHSALVAAGLPREVLGKVSASERLQAMVGAEGESMVIAGRYWVALLSSLDGSALETRVERLKEALVAVSGGALRFSWREVELHFSLSSAGTSDVVLPAKEVTELLARLKPV